MVIKWMKRLKWLRVSKYALIITLLLSLIFAGFTVYGARVGNFNIFVHGDDIQLAIFMKEDMSDLNSHLSVPVLDDMNNTTFESIANEDERNRIMPGLGSKNDNFSQMYLAFSFVLINLSDRMVNYDAQLTVTSSREGMGGGEVVTALRVLVIKEWGYENGSEYEALTTDSQKEAYFRNGSIYALAEKSQADKEYVESNTHYTTQDFISEVQLFNQSEFDLDVNGQVKYTLVFWLEGWDVDCVNSLYGGKIKMRLDIVGR